ncbi:hypothetical protein CR513_36269, partial [Mucuna pruriens]
MEGLRRAPMDALKCHVPPFVGEGDAKAYLDWEMKVEQLDKELRKSEPWKCGEVLDEQNLTRMKQNNEDLT